MSLPFIVLGDKTDHGGTVISASLFSNIGGKGVGRIGDKVVCPRCRGTFPIITGQLDMIVDGQPVAVHGDKTACGATLLSSTFTSTWGGGSQNSSSGRGDKSESSQGIQGNHGSQGSENENRFVASSPTTESTTKNATHNYDQHFLLLDEVTNKPLANRKYKITFSGGEVEGETGEDGLTQLVKSASAEQIKIEVFAEGAEA